MVDAYPIFVALDATALEGGRIYIGAPNADPEYTPMQVFWDAALTVAASQPLLTSGGVIVRDGTPAQVFAQSLSYSIRVRDRSGAVVWYKASAGGSIPSTRLTFPIPTGPASVVPGPSNNTRVDIAALKQAAISDLTSLYDKSLWTWLEGDYTGQDDNINVVASDYASIEFGAWVRQDAAGIAFNYAVQGAQPRSIADKLGDIGFTSADAPLVISDGSAATTSSLQNMVNLADCTILSGLYWLDGPITIPAGRTVRVQPGTTFRYTGPDGTVFRLGDGSALLCTDADGSVFTVRCDADRPFVWAVGLPNGVSDWRVVGVQGYRCSHVQVGGNIGWADIVTPAMKKAGDTRPINQGRNGLIVGGGATFDVAPGSTISGAAFLSFMDGLRIRDCTYIRCSHGVQWWGGNADVNADGAVANERKAVDYTVSGCVANDCSGGGIWGSMGKNVLVVSCKSRGCGDLSFDVEGCEDVTFAQCHGEDGHNGNFNTYSYNKGILWSDCVSVSTSKSRPVTYFYNLGQNQENNDLTWVGGRLDCTDPTGPSEFAGTLGSARHVTVRGAMVSNVKFNFVGGGQGQITISDNTIVFPFVSDTAFTAIAAQCLQKGYGQAMSRVSNNRIFHEPFPAVQPAGTKAISLVGIDPNLPVFFAIEGNQVFIPIIGGFAPFYLESGGAMVTRFLVRGNMTDGPIQKRDTGTPGIYTIPEGSNVNQVGVDAPVVTV